MDNIFLSIVSFLGIVSYCIVVTIPFNDIIEIYKTKEVTKYPYLILICFSFSAYVWTVYGIKQQSLTLIISSKNYQDQKLTLAILYLISIIIRLKAKKTCFRKVIKRRIEN